MMEQFINEVNEVLPKVDLAIKLATESDHHEVANALAISRQVILDFIDNPSSGSLEKMLAAVDSVCAMLKDELECLEEQEAHYLQALNARMS